MTNLVLLSDSYKYSHWNQYPEGTEYVYSYMEARGGEYDEIVFFGLQYLIDEFIHKAITKENVDEAEELAKFHGIPFYREGWDYIVNEKSGYLPIKIDAVPEGTVSNVGDVLMTIVNTDPKCWWVTNWAETLLMKLWYPTTVATKSREVRKMLTRHWDKSADSLDGVAFAYHNFGDRGSTSVEAAMVGGMAHLTQFLGTDNFNAVKACKDYYGELRGHSIPATEHSTITSWGKDNEISAIHNFLIKNKNQPIIACVSDSYDIYAVTDRLVRSSAKTMIERDDFPIFVIRPDSGNPLEVIPKMLEIMVSDRGTFTKAKYTINSKGYRVFNKYRIIWGDGITPEVIDKILDLVEGMGYSAENFAFGSGGDLMQNVNRDTCKFAIKCSAVMVDGEWRDVFKDPITDKGKTSKKGLVTNDKLQTVYDKFPVKMPQTMSEISERSK